MKQLCSVLVVYVLVLSECFVSTADGQACSNFAQVTRELWDSDLDRLSSDDITLNFQTQLADRGNIEDRSPERLFGYVNSTRLTSPVYTTFLALLDNYDPGKGDPEVVTTQETAEEETFLDAVLSTPTGQILLDYLVCRGQVQDGDGLRAVLRRIWFDLYPRSGKSSVLDTSGFEHVMVGEFKSSGKVNGLHSWLAFYEKERNNEIDYYGHTCDVHTNTVCAAYDWSGRKKRMSTFFLGVSPAYDLSIYSLCFLLHRGTCPVVVGGEDMQIRTYRTQGHLATAFVVS